MFLRPEHLLLAGLLAFAPAASLAQEGRNEEPGGLVLRPLEGAESGAEEQAESGPRGQADGAPEEQAESAREGEADGGEEAVTSPGVSEEVKESQPPAPNEQGMLQTETLDEEEDTSTEDEPLYALLAELRRAPPGLDGQPIERPNPLASEPTLEMDPVQPLDAYLFPEDYIE